VATLVLSDNRKSLIVENGTMQTLELIDVEYKYTEEAGKFSIGPINCSFNSGEVIFITGGNGSGKSTLAKLICGLYAPAAGEIKLDGKVVDALHLNEMCAAIYSDYHIFEKLYGIDHHQKEQLIADRMEILQLIGKTAVNNDGSFSTIRLSTGQRKRIALLVSYLENKPIYMFDEWAADQDPEFKSFFYEELLPELKLQGKCVIVISHDNHYFHVATRMIKMEAGRLKVTNVLSV
ncbi:ATP-binding cassette domain-containing protein, partial [Chitinophaga sp.]|uniref:ATP-binding cassette domain-containing protein n=1 Tax=Chitinophaga sp. TaxID=1869181 RepID=UPI002F9234FA